MPREKLFAIDVGTQSIRALIFNLQGDLLYKVQIPIESYFSKHPGWAEQHPDYFWDKLCLACQKMWVDSDINKSDVAGVALTTQRYRSKCR